MKHLSQLSSLMVILSLSASAALLSGCGRDDAKVTVVPKESSATPVATLPPGHPEMGSQMSDGSEFGMGMHRPRISYDVPEGWSEVSPGSVRVASFKIARDNKQADMSVIPLGGEAGGDVPNLNRWRGQVGLEPVTEQALRQMRERVEIGGEPADLYDMAGTNPGSGERTRVIGAIQHRGGTAWFFKLIGDDTLVASQKPAFLEYIKSVRFLPQDHHGLPPSHPPIGMGGMDSAMRNAASGPISREGQPAWTVPSGWEEVPGGQFLVGKFVINGQGSAQAAVNVSASAGDGGGFANNVNRWRRQIGLDQVGETDIERQAVPLAMESGKGTLIELAGTDPATQQPTRVVGIMVPQGGQTFYYKLAGDAALVSSQKDAFVKFVQTAKY